MDYAGTFNIRKETDNEHGSFNVVSSDRSVSPASVRPAGRLGQRKDVRAIGDMLVTYADGSTKVVPKRKRGETNRTLAKRARIAEIQTYMAKDLAPIQNYTQDS